MRGNHISTSFDTTFVVTISEFQEEYLTIPTVKRLPPYK
nr:MAG TPA: hypothetical protein [Caudoviricetes sp.]